MTYVGPREPVQLNASLVSNGFFSLFGLNPVAGRGFSPVEQVKGAALVCILDAAFAAQEFGSPVSAVGRSLALNGKSYNVVGVMPAMTPSIRRRAQVWFPLEAAPPLESHGSNYLFAVGVLSPAFRLPRRRAILPLSNRRSTGSSQTTSMAFNWSAFQTRSSAACARSCWSFSQPSASSS